MPRLRTELEMPLRDALEGGPEGGPKEVWDTRHFKDGDKQVEYLIGWCEGLHAAVLKLADAVDELREGRAVSG